MPDYLTITCRMPAAAEGYLAQALEHWPVLGCEVADAGRDIDITVYLQEARASALPAVCEGLCALGAEELGTGHFAEQDWLRTYRDSLAPVAIGGRFWIDPHPASPTLPPDRRIHLVIEPRQAFGTGSHESTRLVLLLLEELALDGAVVLDVGTGSGILALAARALGAAWAVGFDIDAEAVFVAHQTIEVQRSPLRVALFAGSTDALAGRARFDLVLANLLPDQVCPLLADLASLLAPTGELLLSGLMADQRATVEAELQRNGLVVGRERALGEWLALVCQRL
ncbi:MAG: 50S ribosomal protein L11 methyltransferase [Acidobacteriota bacterium]